MPVKNTYALRIVVWTTLALGVVSIGVAAQPRDRQNASLDTAQHSDKWFERLRHRAEEQLYDLRPRDALKTLEPAQQELLNPPKWSSYDRAWAAGILARTYAELGRFQDARRWLQVRIQKYPDPVCGVYQAGLESEAEITCAVWQDADVADDERQARLRQIVAKVRWVLPVPKSTEGRAWTRDSSAAEARLLLGELLYRRGDFTAAEFTFQPIVGEKKPVRANQIARLARAYTRRIQRRKTKESLD